MYLIRTVTLDDDVLTMEYVNTDTDIHPSGIVLNHRIALPAADYIRDIERLTGLLQGLLSDALADMDRPVYDPFNNPMNDPTPTNPASAA